MTVPQSFDRPGAESCYTEWQRIIAIGAYSESPPEDYEEDWEEDGSLWYGDVNIDDALATLEARADAEDLKFILHGDKSYKLVPLTEKEKKERRRRRRERERPGREKEKKERREKVEMIEKKMWK